MSKEFLSILNKQTDIDEIVILHESFLKRLIKSCLLENKVFQSTLFKVFNLILNFCDMWRRGINYFNKSISANVEQLEKDLNIYFEFTYKILSAVLNRNQSNSHFQSLIAILKQLSDST